MKHPDSVYDPVLSHEWLVVAMSDEIGTQQPHKVTVLGEDIVLWRSETGIHAFRDLCIHRGTALSLGRVEDGNLVCPYHGWQYEGSGQCVRIPAQPDLPIPTKARAHSYACQERYGLVWLALNDPKADIPMYPEGLDK